MGKGSTSSDPVIEVVNVVNSKFDDVNNDISTVTAIANGADAKATSTHRRRTQRHLHHKH